jgi:adenine-specific DNA-methyltransferase
MADEEVRPERVEGSSPDLKVELLARLRQAAPEAFSEGLLDLEKLRELAGDGVASGPERFSFNWAGKRDAIALLQTPTSATLLPVAGESVDFEAAQHVFIEGDNLEVLKLLYRSYFGKVRMIYIDPPYNTGSEFIYPDDFSDPLDNYLRLTGQKNGDGDYLSSKIEKNGRIHSNWLSMMYPRLAIARQLLRDDGVIFVSIDDHEVHNLRSLLNELFGEENFVATVIWQKMYAPKSGTNYFSEDHDYVVVYARDKSVWRPELLPRTAEQDSVFKNVDDDPRGRWRPNNLAARNYYSKGTYAIKCPSGRIIEGPPKGSYWRVSEEKFWRLDRDGRIWWGEGGNNVPAPKIFLSEVKQGRVPQTLWKFGDVGHTQEAKKELLEFVKYENTDNVLDSVKPTRLLQQMLTIGTSADNGDIVLDFFSGSSTTGHAVIKQNREDGGRRRYIGVQFPEPLPVAESKLKTLADVGKERLRAVIAKKAEASQGDLDLKDEMPEGFRVFKLTPSHMKRWPGIVSKDPEVYRQELLKFADPLIPGWEAEGLIWEVALREGYSLTSRVEKLTGVDGHTFWRVTDSDRDEFFYACLDVSLSLQAVAQFKLTREILFVCRDQALDDTLAANLALQCRLKVI